MLRCSANEEPNEDQIITPSIPAPVSANQSSPPSFSAGALILIIHRKGSIPPIDQHFQKFFAFFMETSTVYILHTYSMIFWAAWS